MKLRLLAMTCAVLGLSFALGAPAGATTINVRPYALSVISIGSTAPGDPASTLCLVTPDNPTTYGGKINGVVAGGHAGELNIHLFEQDLTTQVATCVPTSIQVSTDDPNNIGIQSATKPGGTLQISTAASVQPGILAASTTTVDVHYSAGQVVKVPGGGSLVSGTLDNPAGGVARMTFKPVTVKTKSLLDTAACSDNQYLVDTNQPDGTKFNAPRAFEIGEPLGSVPPGVTLPSQGDPGVYVATIRGCAQQDVVTAGKPVKVKISVAGAGTASVDFVQSNTIDPQTWDTTRGKTCSGSKTAGTFGDGLSSSRVLTCKGDYGDPIPLALDVRGWVPNTPGQLDPYGLLHPAPPVQILSYTFS